MTVPLIPLTRLVAAALLMAACRSGGAPEPAEESPAAPAEPPATAWRWVAPPPSYVGMPAGDGVESAVTYGHSHVVLLDDEGRPRWTADHLRLRDVAPRLTADAVLVPAESGLVAFDRATGALRWALDMGERANTPVVAGRLAVISTWDASLLGIDLERGEEAWRLSLPGASQGVVSEREGLVVATWSATDGDTAGMVAVDAATGERRWAIDLPPGGVSGPALVAPAGAGEMVAVVVAGDIAAHGFSAATGSERWRVPLEGAGSPEVVPLDAGGGGVLVAHRLGGMSLLDASDGRARWTVSSDGAAVRGGPVGPGPGGRFALPLHDGRLLLAGPDAPDELLDPPGRVSGVATGPRGTLLVGVRETTDNDLTAITGW